MSVLLQHEKQAGKTDSITAIKGLKQPSTGNNSSDSSDDEKDIENIAIRKYLFWYLNVLLINNICKFPANVEFINNSDSEDDIPMVHVAGRPIPIDEIDNELIAKMTRQEKDNYIQVYQEHFSHMYD